MKTAAVQVRAFLSSRSSRKLCTPFNTLQPANLMWLVVFAVLLVFMTMATVDGRRTYATLPKVLRPVSLPGEKREHAIKVFIRRDGVVYFGVDRVNPADLAARIKNRLKDSDIEHKVYIVADLRARWGTVKQVLQGVHDAGIIRVAFLADERRFH